MRVLLLNPPYLEYTYTKVKRAVSVQPPLGIAYIAAMLEKNGIDVKILDANAESLSMQKTIDSVIISSADFIGITATTVMIPKVYQLCDEIKENSDKTIVVGGPHVTFMPERTLEECKSIDIIVRGEGELTMVDLTKKNDLSTVKGITYRNNGRIISNPDKGLIADIDEIPFPTRHLLPMNLYRSSTFFNIPGSKGHTTLITARGCPNKCVFCSSSHFWGKLRMRSPENIVAEVEEIVTKYGIRQIDFVDDTFTLSKKRVDKICNMILERDLDIKWVCSSRVNTITKELIKTMKKAGCYGIVFGIESGNQAILNRINKNTTLDQSKNAIQLSKKEGLITVGDFMIGLPDDTLETVTQTINFAIELNPDRALFSMTTPFPGTTLYNEYLEKGLLKDNLTWDEFSLHTGTKFRNENLTAQEIEKLYLAAKRRFYIRPAFITKCLAKIIKNPYELKSYMYGGLYLLLEKSSKREAK